MDIEFRLDPTQTEPKITITAAALTDEVNHLLRRLEYGQPSAITALQGDQILLLAPERIVRFFADGKSVSVQTAEGVYAVRERLYELEERLNPHKFVRISHSEIVNLDHVTGLDLSITGTIRMTLTGGVVCFVSRRSLKKIKQALNL
jgi:DNA-binding LytR/AlgR family response regulator